MCEKKQCAFCAVVFDKPVKISARHWESQQFCSHSCSARGQGRSLFAYFVADAATECWNWIGYVDEGGYGKYRGESAHREGFELFNGSLPLGKWALHRCDNRRCINPYHLFVGDVQANVDDMFSKGRANKAKGENVGGARLEAHQIPTIRADPRNNHQIAKDYGVHPETIGAVKRGKTWNHV